jgi:Ethylbenzene dehydrogenase/Prokaryotic cytochrome b561
MSVSKVHPRADLPTVLIHWGLVLALLTSVSTGWRIASMTDSNALWRWAEVLMLQGNVLRWHFISAALLTALVVGYLGFLWRMGLGGRLALRWASFKSPDRATRWQAVNKLVYWIAFALLVGATLTGSMMYFAPGVVPMEPLVLVHEYLSWGFVGYIVLHVIAQLLLGGIRQLLKIVTPRVAYGLGGGFAVAFGLAGAAVAYVADSGTLPFLTVSKVSVAPTLDGDASDEAWGLAKEAVVHTSRGFGLQGGEVAVHIKALHDGDRAYFVFRWQDATRSQKHIPLMKTEGGWKLLHSNYYNNDENEYYEDKFAVMLARSPIAGGNTVKLGPKPLADKPGSTHGLGLHVATDGSLADVWHWKGVRSAALNQFDDNYFGPPMDEKPGRYTGGYTQDPKSGGGFDQNFERIAKSEHVKVKYLPKNLAAQQERMGRFVPDVEVSDEGSYAMALNEVVPYSAKADAAIPVGTVIPSVVYDKPFAGDRGDVSAHAQWKDGWWTLEASRRLDTGSKFDQPIVDDTFMWVAVFDHNQVRHTRHVQPLRLRLQ